LPFGIVSGAKASPGLVPAGKADPGTAVGVADG
jgi:hypothetical protein